MRPRLTDKVTGPGLPDLVALKTTFSWRTSESANTVERDSKTCSRSKVIWLRKKRRNALKYGPLAKERLNILRETSDGFRIAEKDLELRGPGEVLGTRQTGMLQFRVADLARDQGLLDRIPAVAEQLLNEEPDLVGKLIRRWIGDADRFASV